MVRFGNPFQVKENDDLEKANQKLYKEIEKLMKQHKIDIENLKEKHKLDLETKEKEHQLKLEEIRVQNEQEILKKEKEKYEYSTIEKAHNQIEKRTYIFVNDIEWIYRYEEWKGIKSIGIAIKECNGKITEKRYYISNLDAKNIQLLSQVIRCEWHVENKLHWHLDYTFKEDENKSYKDNTQKNLNIIRKFCLAILEKYKLKTKLSMRSIRFKISMNFESEIEMLTNSLQSPLL